MDATNTSKTATLTVGKGLVGLIAEEATPLNLPDAQSHPAFAYLPLTGEEIYHSFLGVPVLRAGRTLGVLVVQNRSHRTYTEEEMEALQTTAMVLAEMFASGEMEDLSVPGSDLDALGVVMALVAGCFWAGYILLTARVGRALPGGGGLAIAMTIAAVAVIPVGLADGGEALLDGELLAIGFAVAVLSSALPYSVELEALRRLPESTFGVLMSLEPAAAATVGFLGLDQGLAAREVVAIGLVVAASLGALRAAGTPRAAEA